MTRTPTPALLLLALACTRATLDAPRDSDETDVASAETDDDASDAPETDLEPVDSEPVETDTDVSCEVGVVSSSGTDEDLDLFGEIVWFDGGAELPEGRYRIAYVDGCMKYNASQWWAVHAYADGSAGWWLVGDTTDDRVRMPPGTVGFDAGSNGFETFEACVTANAYLAPQAFDFGGGKLGLWLKDSPYTDNLAGVDGRNPKWRLERMGGCE